jgi:hypothetical protein
MKWMLLLILFAHTALVEAQTQLTAKVGYELAYKEFQGLDVYDPSISGDFNFIENIALAQFQTIQIGGRFGLEKAYEAGIGIAFGSMRFKSSIYNDYAPKLFVFRTSIYVERFFDSDHAFWFGTGAQLYNYRMKMERIFEDRYPENTNGEGVATFRSRGMEWRLLARLYIGEDFNHSITGALGISGEVVVPVDFTMNNETRSFIKESKFVFGIPFALYYSRSF